MRLLVLIALCALVCREAAAQTVEEVMDAFAFAFRGVEADAPLDVSKPVKRSVHTARITYEIHNANGSYFIYIESQRLCVFTLGTIVQGKETDRSTYDINKASRFEFTMYLDRVTGVGGEIRLEGRGVLCTKTGCENAYTTPVRFLTGKPLDRQIEAVKRTDRAVDYIKQRCPGRPY